VWELTSDPNANSIARAVIAMGKSLGLKVIAEGVETFEQAKILLEMGCEEAQGYFYSRPLLPGDVVDWFMEHPSGPSVLIDGRSE
jgi:EAL domain-containing protein (putative c-di-GMP-specific phosphodiesterase class I)